MKKLLTIVAAALLATSLYAASWDFTTINQSDFYPTGQEAVDGNYWTAKGSSSYQYKNVSSADELYVAEGQKLTVTEGLRFLTRGEYFRVFFNKAGIRLQNPNAETGVNPSIVIPGCKAGSLLMITVKRDGSNATTMAVSNASVASLELDGNVQNYTATVLNDADVVINISTSSTAAYVRSIKVLEKLAHADGSLTFDNKDLIIYDGNVALSTVTNSTDQGFAKASNINLYTSSSAEGKTAAIRVRGTSTVTIAAPSNYVIEKIGVRAATEASTGERTIKINNANGENYGVVVENQESHYHEWELAAPSNQLTLSTNGSMYFIITLFGHTTEYYPVTVSNNWATFCAPVDVVLPEALTAYAATNLYTDWINLEPLTLTDNKLAANTPVVLMSEEDATYTLDMTEGAVAYVGTNLLQGTVARTQNPGGVYCLNSTLGAFQQYTGDYIPANKAYLQNSNLSEASIRIVTTPGVMTPVVENVEAVAAKKVVVNGQICILRNGAKYNVAGKKIQ